MAKYTADGILKSIRKFKKQHGRPPTVADFGKGRAAEYPSAGTVVQYFGSWANGVEAAGLKRPSRGRRAAA